MLCISKYMSTLLWMKQLWSSSVEKYDRPNPSYFLNVNPQFQFRKPGIFPFHARMVNHDFLCKSDRYIHDDVGGGGEGVLPGIPPLLLLSLPPREPVDCLTSALNIAHEILIHHRVQEIWISPKFNEKSPGHERRHGTASMAAHRAGLPDR